MATIFGDGGGRGCFIKFNFSSKPSQGAVLHFPDNNTIPASTGSSGLIVTSVSQAQKESVSHLRCFNDTIYTFVFGADVGDLTVNFLAFLCAGNTKSGSGSPSAAGLAGGGSFNKVLQYYANNRISQSQKLAYLTMGDQGGAIAGQVVGLAGSTESTELNIQSFQLYLKTTTPQGGSHGGGGSFGPGSMGGLGNI